MDHDLAAAAELSGDSRRDLLQQFQFSGFRAISLLWGDFPWKLLNDLYISYHIFWINQ